MGKRASKAGLSGWAVVVPSDSSGIMVLTLFEWRLVMADGSSG
jgi:hypothetical protein